MYAFVTGILAFATSLAAVSIGMFATELRACEARPGEDCSFHKFRCRTAIFLTVLGIITLAIT